jgi:hypothetical protein
MKTNAASCFLVYLFLLSGCVFQDPPGQLSLANYEPDVGIEDADHAPDVAIYCDDQDDCDDTPDHLNLTGLCNASKNICSFDCEGTYANCNGDPSDGCEVDLAESNEHCGTCGKECELNSLHFLPICVPGDEDKDGDGYYCDIEGGECAPGYVNIDDDAPGCECHGTEDHDGNCVPAGG